MSSGKYFNRIVAITVVLAVALTSVLLYFSSDEAVVEAMSSSVSMPYEELFDQFEVMEIEVLIDTKEWEDMLENPLDEEYKQCDVKINGNVYADVAIRTKGNTSLSQVAASDSDRYSFKLEFDHYDKNKSLQGLDKLVLNNLFCDATYVKEYIAYDIFHYIGVETPFYAFAFITVNGEAFGCYLALEAMEDSFLERVYKGSGQLYKPESDMAGGGMKQRREMPEAAPQGEMPKMPEPAPQGEMPKMPETMPEEEALEMPETMKQGEPPEMPEDGNAEKPHTRGEDPFGSTGKGSDLVYTDDETDSYSDIFDNASFDPSEEDKQRVVTALEKLNRGEELETCIDVDACLKYFAAQTFIVNMDSYYSNLKHNYYLYENSGQLTILPWDLNLAFGGFQSVSATDAVNSAIDTPMDGLEESRPLFSKLMEVEEYQEQYHSYLSDIIQEYVNGGQFTATLSKIENVISPYVEKDTTAFYSYSEFKEAVAALKTFVLLRAESVEKQLNGDIPASGNERTSDTVLVDASSVQLSAMGMQGGDGAGGKGIMNGNMFGEGPMGQGRGRQNKGDR